MNRKHANISRLCLFQRLSEPGFGFARNDGPPVHPAHTPLVSLRSLAPLSHGERGWLHYPSPSRSEGDARSEAISQGVYAFSPNTRYANEGSGWAKRVHLPLNAIGLRELEFGDAH